MKNRTCIRCSKRKALDLFVKSVVGKDGRRTICKACHNSRKRELRSGDARPAEERDGIYWRQIPCARLKPLAEIYVQENPEINSFGCKASSLPRQIYKVITEETEFVRWDFAERLLINLNLDHMWRIPPQQGGLLDLYDPDEFALRCPFASAQSPAQSSSGPRRASVGRGTPSKERQAA